MIRRRPELRTSPTRHMAIRHPDGVQMVSVYESGRQLLADIPGTAARGEARAAIYRIGDDLPHPSNMDEREYRYMVAALLARGLQPSAFGKVIPVESHRADTTFAYWTEQGVPVPAALPERVRLYRGGRMGGYGGKHWTTDLAAAEAAAAKTAASYNEPGWAEVRYIDLVEADLPDPVEHDGVTSYELGTDIGALPLSMATT